MRVPSYQRGRTFEYRVKRWLESRGFIVIRSAGSRPVDLIAIRDGQAWLVECKDRRGVGPAKEKLRMLREKTGLRTFLALREGDDIVLEEVV